MQLEATARAQARTLPLVVLDVPSFPWAEQPAVKYIVLALVIFSALEAILIWVIGGEYTAALEENRKLSAAYHKVVMRLLDGQKP